MASSYGADEPKEGDKEPSKETSTGDSNDNPLKSLYEIIKGCLKNIFGNYGVDDEEKESEETSAETGTETKKKKKKDPKSEIEEIYASLEK